MNSLAIVIPSVGRPESLKRALSSASQQDCTNYELIVVARQDDLATHQQAKAFGASLVVVDQPGLAFAMRAGAEHTNCDIVAFTDDDAEVPPTWARSLLRHYEDPMVGGVGGRDHISGDIGQSKVPSQKAIGRIDFFGRVVGGHHLATGSSRFVDHLKGVNCSFRREDFMSLNFQNSLFGKGAQSRNEFVASCGITARGRKLMFDPSIVVNHYPGPRGSGDSREKDAAKMYESAYNERLGFVLYRRPRSIRNLIFNLLVGYSHSPGLLRCLRGTKVDEVRATFRGIVAAQSHSRAFDLPPEN